MLHRSHTVLDSRARGNQDRYACGFRHDVSVLRDLREEIVDEDRWRDESRGEPREGRGHGDI